MRDRWPLVTTWLLLIAAGQAMAEDGPSSSDASPLEDGERIYLQYCASCHGPRGEGMPNWERQNAQGELPAPPHGPEGHTWKHSDAMLYRIVSEGWRDPWNKTERLTMPAFKDLLSPAEIRDVVNYLKTLWTPEQRRHQAEESEGAPFLTQSE
ncbi:c-type cytochrome [Halomonas sp. LBP4]|uniref:c-type cytochrome n=1 Tax=Halomonas sp. LBP4 TaxID=2044917 RepID=UPI000D76CDDE|nr:cytochrome c [Halomonas sp. LBP4]PXX95763.1 cytochrome c, class I [Halomonas sp. LBP4]